MKRPWAAQLLDRPSPAASRWSRPAVAALGRAVLFAILAGVSAATWTICLKLASTKITPALGALVITTGALAMNSLVLLGTRAYGHEIVWNREALWLMALAGVAAAGWTSSGSSPTTGA